MTKKGSLGWQQRVSLAATMEVVGATRSTSASLVFYTSSRLRLSLPDDHALADLLDDQVRRPALIDSSIGFLVSKLFLVLGVDA